MGLFSYFLTVIAVTSTEMEKGVCSTAHDEYGYRQATIANTYVTGNDSWLFSQTVPRIQGYTGSRTGLVPIQNESRFPAKTEIYHGMDSDIQTDALESFQYQTNVTNTPDSIHTYINNVTNTPDSIHTYINNARCLKEEEIDISGTQGFVFSVPDNNYTSSAYKCQWKISVPNDLFLSVYVQFVHPCQGLVSFVVFENNSFDKDVETFECYVKSILSRQFLSGSNRLHFHLSVSSNEQIQFPEFKITFYSWEQNQKATLPVVFTSSSTGFVTSPGYTLHQVVPCKVNSSLLINVPDKHVVMVSFPDFEIGLQVSSVTCKDSVELYAITEGKSPSLIWRKCDIRSLPAEVHLTDILIRLTTTLQCLFQRHGFRMMFSFHPIEHAPFYDASGLFDCSVSHYGAFRLHLDCNLEPECLNGEDETADCPYSSSPCNGSVAFEDKCYTYHKRDYSVIWYEADYECRRRGSQLAMMKTEAEFKTFKKIFQYSKVREFAHVGLRSFDLTFPVMYKRSLIWVDGTVSYGTSVNTQRVYASQMSPYGKKCAYYSYSYNEDLLEFYDCTENFYFNTFICEHKVTESKSIRKHAIELSEIHDWRNVLNEHLVQLCQCPNGHVTHVFLSCDPESKCFKSNAFFQCIVESAKANVTPLEVSMFVCDNGVQTLPYTLVCDFKQDCNDGSDEGFCKHKHVCSGFTCTNGQCIDIGKQCDVEMDCWDGSDEGCQNYEEWEIPMTYRVRPPVMIDFLSNGLHVRVALNDSSLCPQTHFLCSDDLCLPVYVRCNGIYDCPGHEDEAECPSYECPGFYRCRSSLVCVHTDHLCDGWAQCPQRDDELFCDIGCPDGCRCLGLSYVCERPFAAQNFIDVRYLDASGSGIAPNDLEANIYIVWLSLSSCQLFELNDLHFPNVQNLDLSNNKLTSLNVDIFLPLSNLRILNLAKNPLTSIFSTEIYAHHIYMRSLDISLSLLKTLDHVLFRFVPNILFINTSFNTLLSLRLDVFTALENLTEVDFRGVEIDWIPGNLFYANRKMSKVYADDYRFCCSDILLQGFDQTKCTAPHDPVSTCSDLISLQSFRLCLWIMCLLTITGNIGCLIHKVILTKHRTALTLFLSSLHASDFLMGLYILSILMSDVMYRDKYMLHEKTWRSSIRCRISGFLSLLSHVVSTLMIYLIALNQFIIPHFSCIRSHCQIRPCIVMSGIAWSIGSLIAFLPLIPGTAEWQIYTLNSLCSPVPIYQTRTYGHAYYSVVTIVLNLILVIFFSVALATVLLVHVKRILVNNTLTKIGQASNTYVYLLIVCGLVCRFPLGLLSFLIVLDVSATNDVTASFALIIIPIGAAINPLLFVISEINERQRQAEMTRLVKHMKWRLESYKLSLPSHKCSDLTVSNFTT